MKNQNENKIEEISQELKTIVLFKSLKEIRNENDAKKEELTKYNSGLRRNYDSSNPKYTEEMNLNGDPNFMYVGKGSLF